jgi:hypothetical protein
LAYAYSATGANSYTWSALNLYNQHAARVDLPSGSAITGLSVYAGAKGSSVAARLVLWSPGGSAVRQSSSFTLSVSSLSVGGQSWRSKNISSYTISSAKHMWVGLYRNPSGAHVFGLHNGSGNGYRKTNTRSFPSVLSMSGYSTHSGREPIVRATYILKPSPVTSASVSRVSDSKMSISWSRHASGDRPYTYIKIERWNNVSNTWSQIKSNLSGSASSYNDTGVKVNYRYRYRIRAWNAAGYSSYAYTGYIETTPAAPTNVVATRSGSGVVITWNNPASDVADTMKIEYSEGPAYSSWVELDYAMSGSAVQKTDVSPPAIVKYRVWANNSAGLNSAYVESNEVITIVEPNPPTNLSPSSLKVIDVDNSQTFSWQHNPLDTSEQTKFSLRYSKTSSSYGATQVEEEVSTDSYHVFAASTFDSGDTYYWQVQTWGADPDPSGWSDEASFIANTKPEMAITYPENESTISESELTVTWDFSDIDSDTQSQYSVGLYTADGLTLLENISGYGTDGSVTFEKVLENGESYQVRGLVADSSGLWSVEVSADFTVEFLPPVKPGLSLSASEDDASTGIVIENPLPTTDLNFEATQDTYVDGANTGSNYDDVGELDLYDNGTSKYILLGFDLTDIIGKTVNSATLTLNRKDTLSGIINSLVKYITTSWSEDTVTYATLPSLDATEYGDHEHVSGETEEWDITSLIQDIADGTITDFEGLVIIPSGSDVYDNFYDGSVSGNEAFVTVEIEPEAVETTYNKLYRSIDGVSYELALDDIEPESGITDYLPLLVGTTYYYVVAFSETGTSIQSDVAEVTSNYNGKVALNSGEGYNDGIVVYGDLAIEEALEYDRELIQFDGRENALLFEGDSREQRITFSCNLPIEDYDSLQSVMSNSGGGFYRDYFGRWFKASFSNIKVKKKDKKNYEFSCTINKVVG